MLNIVLFQPEIPPNTGNIIRLCANTGAQLHLIKPYGFELDDKRLRRAGLDYHEWASVQQHDSLDAWLQQCQPRRIFSITTKGTKHLADNTFEDGDYLLFGSETRGLPAEWLEQQAPENLLRLPMLASSRSMNLSNCAAVVLYEAWRQLGYPGGL